MTRLPVLTYHAIETSPSPLAVSPSTFAVTMRRLARAGWRTLSDRGMLDGLKDGRWPERSLVIHFDDGCASVQQHAWPILRELGFTATVYVVTDWVGRTNDWPGQPPTVPRWPLMTWDDLGALVADGATLGAHTANHPQLPLLARDEQEHEIGRSVEAIVSATGRAPLTLAYPYGATNAAVSALALGHVDAAYGTRLSFVSQASARGELPRIDAYYLTDGQRADRLDRAGMRAYLSLRNIGRQLRVALTG